MKPSFTHIVNVPKVDEEKFSLKVSKRQISRNLVDNTFIRECEAVVFHKQFSDSNNIETISGQGGINTGQTHPKTRGKTDSQRGNMMNQSDGHHQNTFEKSHNFEKRSYG